VLFHAKDPELYGVWHDLPRRGPPDSREVIRSRFGARWVLCFASPRNARLIERLRSDPGVRPLLESRLWFLYDLAPERPGF
jgi:hypothetical protein